MPLGRTLGVYQQRTVAQPQQQQQQRSNSNNNNNRVTVAKASMF